MLFGVLGICGCATGIKERVMEGEERNSVQGVAPSLLEKLPFYEFCIVADQCQIPFEQTVILQNKV